MKKNYLKYFSAISVFLIFFLIFSKNINFLQDFFQIVFNPFEKKIIKIRENLEGFLQRQRELEELNNKIKNLEKEIALYKLKNRIFHNYYLENKRLKELLSLKNKYFSFKTISANVLSYNPVNWFSTFVIDKGKSDGIKVGLAVVTYEGLVGRVYKVADNHSYVISILDKTTNIGVFLKTSNTLGILKGVGRNYCLLEYLPAGIDVKLGEEVITSGISEYIPYGIPVGKVVEIKRKINEPIYVRVKPYARFNYLKEVLIIKNE